MSTDIVKNFQQLGAVRALQTELGQRQEDIRELREDVAKLRETLDVYRTEAAGLHRIVDSQAEQIRTLRRAFAGEAEITIKLKAVIEAMRTAGGSEEFQIAFDRAKELASAL